MSTMDVPDGAKLRVNYAQNRLKKLHAELIAIGKQLDGDLPRETRDLLQRAKRSKVQSAARWAQMISDLTELR